LDQDGIDDIGLWVPDAAAVNPEGSGEWYFLVSDDRDETKRIDGTVVTLKHPFTPVPFGADLHFTFGNEFAVPLVGNFDPPPTPITAVPAIIGTTNLDNRFDVNGDGYVTPLDVAITVNELNLNGPRLLPTGQLGENFWDVSGEGELTALDALQVIDHINLAVATGGSAEGEFAGASAEVAADQESAVRSLLAELSAGSELVAASISQPLLAAQTDVAVAPVSQRRDETDRDEASLESVLPTTNPTDELLADLDRQPARSVLAADFDDLLENLTRDLADGRDAEADTDDFFSQLGG
jgi:hypothetical protein